MGVSAPAQEAMKCFFRKSDGGREHADGWVSAPKAIRSAASAVDFAR